MGWSYRKSVNLGPFRVNISKSGIGYSLGGTGFRTGVSSGGHRRPRRFGAPNSTAGAAKANCPSPAGGRKRGLAGLGCLSENKRPPFDGY